MAQARKSALVPAALRGGMEKLADEERASGIAAVETFVDQLGGKAAVIEALEIASDQPEVDQVLNLLVDPRYETWSLRKLCQQAGLTIHEFFSAFRKASLVRAQIAATQKIADGLVPVVEDVMRRAAPIEEICQTCSGIGTFTPEPTKKTPNPDPQPCKVCRSSGKIVIWPELERQKLALELAELLKKGGGLNIQNNQLNVGSTAGGTGVGDLEKLQQALSATQFAVDPPAVTPTVTTSSPIEAEILPETAVS